jgi:hypothetical protein
LISNNFSANNTDSILCIPFCEPEEGLGDGGDSVASLFLGGAGVLRASANLFSMTAHGATRLGASSARGGALNVYQRLTTRVFYDKSYLQAKNGAVAYVRSTSSGRFNVAIHGKGGYITSMGNLTQNH